MDAIPKCSPSSDVEFWRAEHPTPSIFPTWEQCFRWSLLPVHLVFVAGIVGIFAFWYYHVFPEMKELYAEYCNGEPEVEEEEEERRPDETDDEFFERLNRHRCPMHRHQPPCQHMRQALKRAGIDGKMKKN